MSDRKRYDHELLGSSFAHNAEQAVITPQGPRNIVTPCHGMPLIILTTAIGRGHLSTEVPDEIECTAEGCPNQWNADGTVRYWQEAE